MGLNLASSLGQLFNFSSSKVCICKIQIIIIIIVGAQKFIVIIK